MNPHQDSEVKDGNNQGHSETNEIDHYVPQSLASIDAYDIGP